jgi:hypothetical protein
MCMVVNASSNGEVVAAALLVIEVVVGGVWALTAWSPLEGRMDAIKSVVVAIAAAAAADASAEDLGLGGMDLS